MGLVLAPIIDGQLEAWKSWNVEITNGRKSEWDDFNHRYGLTRHDVWLAETPNGPMAVVLHEGPGSDTFMQDLAQSDHPFDKWLASHIESFHDMK